jgi:antitoxin component YwqK of YwqJK toxin-antitoxin module
LKKTVLHSIILLALCIATAQGALGQHAVVSLPNMNLLYRGLRNPVEVYVERHDTNKLVLEADGADVLKESGQIFLVPKGHSHTATLRVGIKKRRKTKWILTQYFRVRSLPLPEVLFGTKTGGNMSPGEAVTVGYVNVGMQEGFAMSGVKYDVISYSVALLSPSYMYLEKIQGRKISEGLREKLLTLHGNEFLYVYDVRAICRNNGDTVLCDPLSLHLTNSHYKPPRDYILEGFINNPHIIQSFSLRTSSMDKETMELLASGKKDSVWKLYSADCEGGKLIAEQCYKADTLIWIKKYAEGRLASFARHAGKDRQGTYTDYYDNGNIKRTGSLCNWEYYLYEGDDSLQKNLVLAYAGFTQKFFDLDDIDQPVCGYWKLYFGNGSLYAEGPLDTTTKTIKNEGCKIYLPDLDDPYNVKEVEPVHIVKNGTWKYYDGLGGVKKVTYNKGHIVKRE